MSGLLGWFLGWVKELRGDQADVLLPLHSARTMSELRRVNEILSEASTHLVHQPLRPGVYVTEVDITYSAQTLRGSTGIDGPGLRGATGICGIQGFQGATGVCGLVGYSLHGPTGTCGTIEFPQTCDLEEEFFSRAENLALLEDPPPTS